MDLGLDNKVAVVTGSSKGLGFATVRTLLEEGAKVVISSRSPDNLENASAKLGTSDKYLTVPCDVTKQEDCERLIQEL